ncbi:MAG: metal-dependent hydrolase [Gemmatimonadales bacterium]
MSGVAGAQGQRADGAGREAGIDPVCHTLVGAALARSGLGRRTALGTATLLIGANLPDIDVLAYADGPAADLAFRRGWTHGISALIVLPFLLTGAMVLLDRGVRRLRHAGLPSNVVPREILQLSAIAILTHPILDTLNVYGMRWLMPFDGRWFYGDTLFIVDPWLWLLLAAGVVLGRPQRTPRGYMDRGTRPAQAALAIAAAYVVGMLLLGLAARGIVRREMQADGLSVERLMVAPRLVTPLVRQVVAVQGDAYRVATFRWLGRPHLDPASWRSVPRPRDDDPAMAAARATPLGRRFLGWARFPAVEVEAAPGGGSLLHLIDLRYADRPDAGFGSVTIAVASPPRALVPDGARPITPR